MRAPVHIQRSPFHVNRKPITVISDAGYSYGGWGHVSPSLVPRPDVKIKDIPQGYKFLYCPYCMDWQYFKQYGDGEDKAYRCTGWCGWGNTNEYYVKKYNDLFPQEMGSLTKQLKKGGRKIGK